ncbi:MAG: glutaredoxin [Alteromonadaceae bacterium]|nr:glutaredoxin [Alteromonadaceae bacterium]
MFLIRWPIGQLILLLSFVFSPKAVKRSEEEQQKIDQGTENLALYQLPACPFCVKVRRSIKRNALKIELRNISHNENFRQELISEGGKRTVPCLRIEKDNKVQWLYESNEIIAHLQKIA